MKYLSGTGVRQDFTKALKYLASACNLDNPGGCLGLFIMYYDGKGVKQNKRIAREYTERACNLGSQEGCDLYKNLTEQGL